MFNYYGNNYGQRFALKRAVLLLSSFNLITASLGAAVLTYQVTPTGNSGVGTTEFHYSYFLSATTLAKNQNLDIRFDPKLFTTLSNGTAGSGFDVLLFQPNNPTQSTGDFSALALVVQPSLALPFGVDVLYSGTGTPGAQSFFIDQFAENGAFQGVITEGRTNSLSGNTVPEPASSLLCCFGILAGSIRLAIHRKARLTVTNSL